MRTEPLLLAHGVGGRSDLPLPFGLVVGGAVAAILVSAGVLALVRRDALPEGAGGGRPLPPAVQRVLLLPVWRALAAATGLLGLGLVVAALVFGARDTTNPVPWVVYVLLWVGVVPLSVLVGPAYRWLNPVRTLHAAACRAARLEPAAGLVALPERVGWWPGAAGLLVFVWLELVAPDSTSVPVLGVAVALHVALHLLAGFAFGSRWFERGDPFEVWSGMFGRMSVLGRREPDGAIVLRAPLTGLHRTPPDHGLVAVVAVMLGSTAYDSVAGWTPWIVVLQSGPLPRTVAGTLGLVAVVAAVGLLLVAATAGAGVLAGVDRDQVARLPRWFAPSVVPVALGYVVAHYWSFLVLEGQNAVIRLSDPLGTGADLLGVADARPSTALLAPGLVAGVQVGAVVAGHLLGVVLAHERAVAVLPRRSALVAQLPLLLLMVAYTVGGLLLLFSH